MKIPSFIKKIALFCIFVLSVWGLVKIYYAVTAGFTIGNITSSLAYDPRWKTAPLTEEAKDSLNHALDQEFSYLGKGCQSYVFVSDDGQYVIKFIKYQRFRPQAWIDLFSFLPGVEQYQQRKAIEKKEKLDKLFLSWHLVYNHLAEQTGILYIHLNKGQGDTMPPLIIRDKMGLKHLLDLNQMEFMLQKRADMLQATIDKSKQKESENLIDYLLVMLLEEYKNGFADNDHALMQNTGVLNGRPIHIDVGQFIKNNIVRDPKVYKQEIYDKTYKLRVWLDKTHPELAYHLKARLIALMGVDFYYMGPYVHKGDVAKIPHIP